MRGDLLLDGRNLYDPASVFAAGLRYEGMGRGSLPPAEQQVDPSAVVTTFVATTRVSAVTNGRESAD
jgi:hypothetical protein